jgi:hypothetical protein
MKTLLLLTALLITAPAHGQQMFQPFIAGAVHPSSPRYGYRNYNYSWGYHRSYCAPRARSYGSSYYRRDPMVELRQMWMQQDIQDIADAVRFK